MKAMQTNSASLEEAHKVLFCAHHGFGKTTNAKHMQVRYGRGFIISGESGLRSIGDCKIDYLPFQSFDGKVNEDEGTYSFMSIFKWVQSKEFLSSGYKWVMLDSLTELSDRLMDAVDEKYKGSKNGFEKWGEYDRVMTGVLKIIRDLPMHVVVTCLAKDKEDANGDSSYWPAVQGNGLQKKIPGLFDHVLCGNRTEDEKTGKPRRFIITDEVKGWHGKVRAPGSITIPPWIETGNITEVLDLITV